MTTVMVCIGSACHRRGSYLVTQRLKDLARQRGVEGEIKVAPAFCLGNCAGGVSVKVNDKLLSGVSMDNVDDIFVSEVLPTLNGQGQ